MSLPAIILCDPQTAALRIAALPLLDRLLVAALRAGADSITVVAREPLPPLPRATALGVKFQLTSQMPEVNCPTLALNTRLLVQPADLKAVIARQGRLVTKDGAALPVGVIREPISENFEQQLSRLPQVAAQGVALPVTGAASAPVVSRALWASLTSSADGLVDKFFNRPVGRFLSKALAPTPVSPNQVSVAATLLGLLSAWLFADGDARLALWGAIVLQISAIVDCVDGDLARVAFKESPLGKWLDIVGDQVVHISVFVAIGVGLYRAGCPAPVLPLAASAAVGVIISFIVIVRGLRLMAQRPDNRLQKVMDALTNRDFSVLLLALAWFGKLEWFLWLTAVGVHVFWIVVLAVQMMGRPAAANPRAS
jgi:phosphatidylglycerophosphate synthase